MRSVLLFVAVCGAHASLPWEVKNGMDQTRDMMIKAPAIAKEIFAQVIPGRGFRRGPISAEDCVAMKNMTSETLARMSNSTVECVDGLMSFAETLCTPACQKSEMFGKSSTSGRRLMGGDMESPSKACVDPCFSPLMSSFITLMKSAGNPENPKCASLYDSSSRRNMGRKLLGGNMDNMDSNQVEIILGSLCSKNAKGDYCMELLEQIDNSSSTSESPSDRDAKCASNCDEQSDYPSVGSSCNEIPCPTCDNLFTTSCKTCATTYGCGGCLDCNIANSGECNIQSNKIKMMKGLGCCFGTLVVMSSVADSTTSTTSMANGVQDLKTCGVTVSTTPCPMAGIEQVEVKAQTKLSGITIALFDSAAQTAFKKGMAKTAGVSEKKVRDTGYFCRKGLTLS